MDVSGFPGGGGKEQFSGTGQNAGSIQGFGWLRGSRIPLIVITSFCVFGLITSYWITENTTWKLPHLNILDSLNHSTFKKHPDPQSSHVVQVKQTPKIRCSLQNPDPFSPRMMALLINMKIFRSNHSCADAPGVGIFKEAAFHVERGHLLVRDVKFPDDVRCCMNVVTRFEDEYVSIHKCTELGNEVNQRTAIQPPTEVVMVICTSSKSENYYTDAFQILREKPEVEKRIKTWQEEQLKSKKKVNDDGRLSVIILGMDSVSQAHFERSMPLTKSYLDNDLKAIKLKGYNKVADSSFPNAIPLLSSLTGDELFSSCVTIRDGFAKCPFIWNTFASHGYRTAFFDDDIEFSLINLKYYNAFTHLPAGPTDYYGRPYALLMEVKLGFEGFCHGPRLSFQHLLDNVKTMADMFNSTQRPYFNFIWSSILTHRSYSTLPWLDKPLLEALKYLHENGHFNHTAFILLADHGPRGFYDIYEAMIEDRMPLAYIVLPPWFSQRYPKAFENLRWNGENSVASHFDMHKTLQDMLDLDRFEGAENNWRGNRYFTPGNAEMAKRGQSLFELNPEGRNCETAGIPPLWCLCYEMVVPLGKDSFLAVSAGKAAIEEVNRRKRSVMCETLHLAEIINATMILFNGRTWTKPECREAISNRTSITALTSNSCNDPIYILLSLRGSPHDPVFLTMMVRDSNGVFLAPTEIVREDWYADKGNCVNEPKRAYCICKNFKSGG